MGVHTYRANKQSLQVLSTPNAAASALTAYKPVIDLELLAISFEEGKNLDLNMDGNIDKPKKSFHEHKMELLMSTVSTNTYTVLHVSNVLTSSRMMKQQASKQAKQN